MDYAKYCIGNECGVETEKAMRISFQYDSSDDGVGSVGPTPGVNRRGEPGLVLLNNLQVSQDVKARPDFLFPCPESVQTRGGIPSSKYVTIYLRQCHERCGSHRSPYPTRADTFLNDVRKRDVDPNRAWHTTLPADETEPFEGLHHLVHRWR